MLKLSAHLDLFFPELKVRERIIKFAELGFPGFELWCWWDEKYNINEIQNAAQKQEIEVCAICTQFISLTDPDSRETYLEGLRETIQICKKMNCKTIISQVGRELPNINRENQKASIIDGLKEAAKQLSNSDITLAIEPLNTKVDHPGYFLSSSSEAADIIEAVGSDSVKMLFDVYHQQITEGKVISSILNYIDIIAHFHFAGVPGRHELLSGDLDYRIVIEAINKTGYEGYAGLELFPTVDSETALRQGLKLIAT